MNLRNLNWPFIIPWLGITIIVTAFWLGVFAFIGWLAGWFG